MLIILQSCKIYFSVLSNKIFDLLIEKSYKIIIFIDRDKDGNAHRFSFSGELLKKENEREREKEREKERVRKIERAWSIYTKTA